MTSTKKFERLSKNVIPINYDLSFKPDLEKYVFDGSEEILLQVTHEALFNFNFIRVQQLKTIYCHFR